MRALRIASLVCVVALLGLTALRQLMLDPVARPATNLLWLALQMVPLLAVVPGLWRCRPTGYFLAALVGMLYFIHGVQASFGPADAGLDRWGQAEAALAVALVAAASFGMKALRAPGPGTAP